MSDHTPASSGKKTNPLGGPVLFVILLLLVAGGVLGYVYYTNRTPEDPEGMMGFRAGVEQQQALMKLREVYSDLDGDLLADRPADNLLNPEVLVFSEIATADFDKDETKWKPFLDHLAKATGKQVKMWRNQPLKIDPGEKDLPAGLLTRTAPGTQEQMRALAAGELHITAFNTGAVTAAVNTTGFHPAYCPAGTDGKHGYEMEVIVPASSGVQKPEDLRGKKVAFVSMSSNSGGRAGLVYLKSLGMTPVKDYAFLFTGTHYASIQAVAAGRVDADFVANDLLRSEIEKGKVKPEQYRTIHKSDPFPPLCFGIGHNLDPALADKIRQAFDSFTQLPAIYVNSPSRVKFVKVDYKKDWAFVREVDEKLKEVIEP